MQDINDRLVTIEATLLIQKGQIEILLGLLTSRMDREELIEYLESAATSPDFGDSAKISAREMILYLEHLWGQGLPSGQEQ